MLFYTSELISCTADSIMAGSPELYGRQAAIGTYKKYRAKKNLDALVGDFDGGGNCKSVDPII